MMISREDLLQGDLEDERLRIGRDVLPRSSLAVAQLGGDGEPRALAHAHAEHAKVPALDHLARAERELELGGLVEAAAVRLQCAVGNC